MSGYTSVLIAGATGYVGEKIVKVRTYSLCYSPLFFIISLIPPTNIYFLPRIKAFLKASPKWIVYVLTSSAPKTPVKQALFDSFIAQGKRTLRSNTLYSIIIFIFK